MIQSAMMFALGIFVSGLVWLAFSVALVRRARRLTERRLLAGIATRRAEFDAERDELRARHAVQMHRLEREVSRVLDMATAHRLEADLKERDLMSARAELSAHREDFDDIETRFKDERDAMQELERRHAETGSALRAAQHQLQQEKKRRAAAEEALDEASILADQRRVALAALRTENDALRERLGEEPGAPLPYELEEPQLPRAVTAMDGEEAVVEEAVVEEAAVEEAVVEQAPQPEVGGSVVPLRPRPVPVEPLEQPAAAVAEAADEGRSVAAAEAEDEEAAAAPAAQRPRMPDAPGVANVGELVALRTAGSRDDSDEAAGSEEEQEVSEEAESQFFEALAKIRALKRTANQAGE
jgi:hypothetical protein